MPELRKWETMLIIMLIVVLLFNKCSATINSKHIFYNSTTQVGLISNLYSMNSMLL